MTSNGNPRSLLMAGGVALMAGLALSGCDRGSPPSKANGPAVSAATGNATNPAQPSTPATHADGSGTDHDANDVADMERHHQQAMDHAQMRAGAPPSAVPSAAAQPDAMAPADSTPAPMKDM